MPGMATDRQPTARPPAGLDNDDVRRRGTTVAVTLRALARLVARRARTLGSRARPWLVLGLGFSVFRGGMTPFRGVKGAGINPKP